ncbi:hypothetical protein L4X63_05995 [Geomonas sp. Red32]|uniref:hypothetical protein n=1 Tax=Geomonas sp. Red32 TaxID=2912856 RepID=UPI00202CBF02|nr:hypothetical protein [Geomonas sp. Red32]MCM0081137.1 hypothetical protein [Geomonas sp. Red32]
MRKTIVPLQENHQETVRCLNLDAIARVEVTSEDPSHPIEAALVPPVGEGWRAATPGKQLIRLKFDQPQHIRVIALTIKEPEHPRTQEFVIRWGHGGGELQEIVRQQFNFSPPGTTTEQESYDVDLPGVEALEIEINPDLSSPHARATLARFRVG